MAKSQLAHQMVWFYLRPPVWLNMVGYLSCVRDDEQHVPNGCEYWQSPRKAIPQSKLGASLNRNIALFCLRVSLAHLLDAAAETLAASSSVQIAIQTRHRKNAMTRGNRSVATIAGCKPMACLGVLPS